MMKIVVSNDTWRGGCVAKENMEAQPQLKNREKQKEKYRDKKEEKEDMKNKDK